MLEYNTSRNKLIIREYGRNIQKMIEDAVKIEDREKRNEAAKAIVKAMSLATTANGNVSNTQIQKERESIDYWRKLWDHLFIISNYQLDVDSPFPKPRWRRSGRPSLRSSGACCSGSFSSPSS